MLSGNLGLPNKKNCGKDSFFRLENCNTEPFDRFSCIIHIIEEYLQNVDFFYL